MKRRAPQLVFTLALMLLGFIVGGAAIYAGTKNRGFLDSNGAYYGHDFINYWAGPAIAAKDISALFDNDAYNDAKYARYGADTIRHNWSYPPHVLALLAPLSKLPYMTALALWSAIGLGIFMFIVARYAPTNRGWCVALTLLSPAILINLFYGQNGFFTGALTLAAVALLHARPTTAGAALGLLTVKPQLGLAWPVLLLAQRRWRTIAMAVVVMTMLIALSVALYGIGAWRGFFSSTLSYQSGLISVDNRTYETMMCSLPLSLLQWGASRTMAFGSQGILAIIVVATLVWRLRRPHDASSLALCLTAGGLLLTPYAFNYDMTALTVALVWHLVAHPTMGRLRRYAYAAGYLLPGLVYWFYFFLPVAPFVLFLVYLLTVSERSHSA